MGQLGLVLYERLGTQYDWRDGYGSRNGASTTDGIATDAPDTNVVVANQSGTCDWIIRGRSVSSVGTTSSLTTPEPVSERPRDVATSDIINKLDLWRARAADTVLSSCFNRVYNKKSRALEGAIVTGDK